MTDSELDKQTSTPLQIAYRNARRQVGGAEVYKCLKAHKSLTGVLSDVPEARRPACLIALTKLSKGEKKTTGEDAFAGMRAKAYGEKTPPVVPRVLDDKAVADIYSRWNAKKEKPAPTED